MRALRAAEAIRERGADMTPEAVYRNMLEATGSASAAERAASQRAIDLERMKAQK
jgi:hypothetical protein